MKLQMILLAAAAAMAGPLMAENTTQQVMRLTAPDGSQRYFMLDKDTKITVLADNMLDISTAEGSHSIAVPDVRVIHYVEQPTTSLSQLPAGDGIIVGIDGPMLRIAHSGRSMNWRLYDAAGTEVAAAAGVDSSSISLDGLAAGLHILSAPEAPDFSFKFIIR